MTRTGAPIVTPRQAARRAEDETFGQRRTDRPETGFFAYRHAKGAVEVAARIEYRPLVDPETGEPQIERSFYWFVTVNGEEDADARPEPTDLCWRVSEFGRRIAEAEYRFLLADRQWAAQHRPELPEATPTKPIDLRTLDPKLLL